MILEGIPYVFLPITRLPMRTDLEALAHSNQGVANNVRNLILINILKLNHRCNLYHHR